MEIVEYLLAKKKAEASAPTVEQLSVTENGTYSEQGIAYSPVVVNVPAPENSYQLTDIPTGAVSTITDGTDLPMPSLKAGIEPVQDLNGYDHPWAGGAGKNLANIADQSGITSQTALGSVLLPAGTYTLSAMVADKEAVGVALRLINLAGANTSRPYSTTEAYIKTELTFTLEEEKEVIVSIIGAASGYNGSVKEIQIEQGSAATSYEPYSNICPISGWTAANVTRTGKNLVDNSNNIRGFYYENGNYDSNINYRTTGLIPVLPNTQYTASLFNSDKEYANSVVITEWSSENTVVAQKTTASFTTSETARYVRLRNYADDASVVTSGCYYQLELGTTATTYEPYNGTTYNIQFTDGDNPLTVYGGTLNVTTGELVVTNKLLYMDGSFNVYNVAFDSSSQLYYTIVKNNLGAATNNPLPQSDKFKSYATVQIGNCYITNYGNYLIAILPDQSADTIAKVTQWFSNNPTQFVYKLATTQIYQLTPTQIRTLVGTNNIWADTGDIIEGKYFKEL